jgi:hypothetical protein
MVCNPGERGDVASGNPDGKAVSGGFLSLLMGPISCAKLKEIGNKHFTHLPSCSNLQASNGYDITHTHAWVYKCISARSIPFISPRGLIKYVELTQFLM